MPGQYFTNQIIPFAGSASQLRATIEADSVHVVEVRPQQDGFYQSVITITRSIVENCRAVAILRIHK